MPFNPEKFYQKHQEHDAYLNALAELMQGQKTSHWIWYIFPQLTELGRSDEAKKWGLDTIDEACAYLRHPQLFAHYKEILGVVAEKLEQGVDAFTLMGGRPDDLKLVSSVTLFSIAAIRLARDPSVTDPKPFKALAEICHRVLKALKKQHYIPCEMTLNNFSVAAAIADQQKPPSKSAPNLTQEQPKVTSLKPKISQSQLSNEQPVAQTKLPKPLSKPELKPQLKTTLAEENKALLGEITAHIVYLLGKISTTKLSPENAKVRMWRQKLQVLEAAQNVLVETTALQLGKYFSTKMKSPQFSQGVFAHTPQLTEKVEAILPKTYERRCLALKARIDHHIDILNQKITAKPKPHDKKVLLWQQKIAVLAAASTVLGQSVNGNKDTAALTRAINSNARYAQGLFSETEALVEKAQHILSKK